MKQLFKNIFYSFPIQLFILHFRKYQILLIFWYLIASTINSDFMKNFGADALFFAPEYLGNVNALSALIVGVAWGIFNMSWNITTFILHSKRCNFLATAPKPFVKYCVNNAILPLLLLLFYLYKLIHFNLYKELMSGITILYIIMGFLIGFILILAISFLYFFSAEKTIIRNAFYVTKSDEKNYNIIKPNYKTIHENFGLKVSYYFSNRLQLKKARDVSHYSQAFLDMIFKKHHIAAIISIVLAFIFLAIVGFFLDNSFFQVPAAASILIFFAIMTAVIGAITYFLQSWSLPFVILLIFFLNLLYNNDIIDPRNKAYGLNYINKSNRPSYNKQAIQQLCTPKKINADKENMIAILENWKNKQNENKKPCMIFINVSGGGIRSSTFVMNTLQQLDSLSNGKLMQQTMLISGASGGMLAATYYRELYRNNLNGSSKTNLHNESLTNNITQDLLNPIFSSMIARDIFAPAQKFKVDEFKYVKDRGYAFEEKLNYNTNGILNKQIKDFAKDEKMATVPLLIFNNTISRDGRQMMICSQPLSFLMKPLLYAKDTTTSPDAIDFNSFFANQSPTHLRLLTALRMNATFPYVLPNVWLPTNPVIDVMDAGLRDNFGQETTLRFIDNFKDWIKENTSGIIIIQLRDRNIDNWQTPFENVGISDLFVKPATMLQHNWFKLQDYSQTNQFSYLYNDLDSLIHRINFTYQPQKDDNSAPLNFHLTAQEKIDVIASFKNEYNQHQVATFIQLIK